jgi:hypothetical protein
MTTRCMVLLAGLALGACSVGEVSLGDDTGGDDVQTGCVDRVTPIAAHTHTQVGLGTAAGQGCVAGGCHLAAAPGVNAPPYYAGGTVYKADKTTPQGGVTVRITAMTGGKQHTAVTDAAGNFYFPATVEDLKPALTSATACPGEAPMISRIVNNADANCNSAACHLQPGGVYGAIKLTAD